MEWSVISEFCILFIFVTYNFFVNFTYKKEFRGFTKENKNIFGISNYIIFIKAYSIIFIVYTQE
jgi:hypothetical protein